MADMTPQEAALVARDGGCDISELRQAARVLADIANPPKPKAEWRVVGHGVRRDAKTVAFCYDNNGYYIASDTTLVTHRATIVMHALSADEEGIDVVALIEKERR